MNSSLSRTVRGLGTAVAAGAIVGGTLLASTAHASPAGNPLGSLSATQIAQKAMADLKAAPSFHYYGSGRYEKQSVSISLSVTAKGCTGSMSVSGQGSLNVVLIGSTLYMQPSDALWKKDGIPAAELSKVHGKWLKLTGASSQSAGLLCSASKLSGAFGIGKLTGLVKGKTIKLYGHSALQLKAGGADSLYVSISAKPELLRISASDGTINFNDYGAKVKLTAPPASDIITIPGSGSAARAIAARALLNAR
jgi:hypothetical protein